MPELRIRTFEGDEYGGRGLTVELVDRWMLKVGTAPGMPWLEGLPWWRRWEFERDWRGRWQGLSLGGWLDVLLWREVGPVHGPELPGPAWKVPDGPPAWTEAEVRQVMAAEAADEDPGGFAWSVGWVQDCGPGCDCIDCQVDALYAPGGPLC